MRRIIVKIESILIIRQEIIFIQVMLNQLQIMIYTLKIIYELVHAQYQEVVTAAANMEHIIVGKGIKHIVYPLIDGKNENIYLFFDQFYQLIQQSFKRGSILVHCAAGISRSSTLVISYLMKRQKLTFKDAITFVRKFRPSVLPNLGFERQLKKYEQVLKGNKYSRSSKRSNARRSQSGKSEGSIRSNVLPWVSSYQSNIPNKNENMDRQKKIQLCDKDIQILKIYNYGRRQMNKNLIMNIKKGRNIMISEDRLINRREIIRLIIDRYIDLKWMDRRNNMKEIIQIRDVRHQIIRVRLNFDIIEGVLLFTNLYL